MLPAQALCQAYRKSLYGIVPFTTVLGFSAGITELCTSETKVSAPAVLTNVIAYTTTGTLAGLTYPLSFPAIVFNAFR
jgi:hypothetical protein